MVKQHSVTDTEAAAIVERTAQKDAVEPRAQAASYDAATDKLVVELRNGVELRIPTRFLQGVAGAAPELIAKVQVRPSGHGLHWEELDADLTVPALAAGIFGSQAWMHRLGASEGARQLGRVTSVRKSKAARANGARGGRPRKAAVVQISGTQVLSAQLQAK